MWKEACTVAVIVLASSVALAQPAPQQPGTQPVPPPEPVVGPPPTGGPSFTPQIQPQGPAQPSEPSHPGLPQGVLEDANSDRVFFAPSALTPPAGAISFSSYEVLIGSLSYSPSDNLQLTLTGLLPIFPGEVGVVGFVAAKYRFALGERTHAAIYGSIGGVADDDAGLGAGLLGGAVTQCLDTKCSSLVNAFIGSLIAADSSGPETPFVGSVGFVHRMSGRFAGLLELNTLLNHDDDDSLFLLNYGIRIAGRTASIDIGMMKPYLNGSSADELPLGFPFVAFSYRGGQF